MLYRKQLAEGKVEQGTRDMIWHLIDPVPVKIALLTEDSEARFAEIGGVFVDPLEWLDGRWITEHIEPKLRRSAEL